MNKKEYIFFCIKQLDFEGLAIVLDDQQNYHGISQITFMEKIREIFEQFHACGDSHLTAYPVHCLERVCRHHTCLGYSFEGNLSKKHFVLGISESAEGQLSIHNSHNYEFIDPTIANQDTFKYYIYDDEKITFHKSPEYQSMIQSCQSMMDQLQQKNSHFMLEKPVYLAWLEVGKSLFEAINKFPYTYSRIFERYDDLYSDLSTLASYLYLQKEVKDALLAFDQINRNEEMELLRWLVFHEQLGEKFSLFLEFHSDIDPLSIEPQAYFEVQDLKIKTIDFEDILKFIGIFNQHYNAMLEKYASDWLEMLYFYGVDPPEKSDWSLTFILAKKGITFF